MVLQEAYTIFLKKLGDVYSTRELEIIWRDVNHYQYLGLEPKVNNKLDDLILRLKNNEPHQYILGQCYFYDFDIFVSEDTLIPRPETEELVYLILQNHKDSSLKILDVGTGSGCIALALGKHIPTAKIEAFDVSEPALVVARKNAKRMNLLVDFVQVDILEVNLLDKKYDVIVSNPPYIPPEEKELMHKNVLNYEPHIALFVSTEDPLVFYKKISVLAKSGLKDGGSLYFECNEFNAEDVKTNMLEIGFKSVQIILDMQGKKRMIKAEV